MASINAAGTNMENIGVTSEGADVPSFGHVLGAVNDSVVGFENENDMITKCLVGNDKDLKVISIVGMPGTGKTTLAMKLFKSYSVVHHFDRLAQGIVSQKFNKRGLILKILSQVKDLSSMEVNQLDEEALADMLCKSLKKHRYIILIDDVWDISVWHYIKRYLPDDRQGSRVLITTRNNGIALDIGSEVHILGPLGEDESWELFQKCFSNKENLSEKLMNIAKRISEGCKGLPLSIVVIAGVLSNVERREPSWNRISRSVNLHILADPQFHCKRLLDMSFNNLPHHLQTCLLYLGRFPENREISVSRLTWLWLAEGLVQDTESKSFEDVAKDYIMNLLLRNLIILSKEGSEGGVKTFRIHDLLRDFCLEKARKGQHISGISELGNPSSGNRNNRLSSCNVRSVVLLPDEFKIVKSQDTFFISDSLSLLVGLRYLMIQRLFSNFSLNSMPSMSTLRNLQTLIIKGSFVSSSDVVEVPDFIWDLVKLRQLHVRNRASFELDILRIQNNPSFLLEDLRSLSKPNVSHDDLKWLTMLPKLQKLSCIVSDTWDDCLHCHRLPEMDLLSQLTALKMELWMQSKEDIRRYKFRLPLNLKKLTLILFVVNSEDISEIGKMLPSLQVLKLYQSGPWGSEEVERWSVSDEDFPKLKVLKLVGVRFNEWTTSDDSFPCLEKLWLEKCFWLEAIPLQFGDIPTLRLISVIECKSSVDSSAKEIERVQKEEQNEQLEVYIYPKKWRIFNMSSVLFRKWRRLGIIFDPNISGGLMFKNEKEENMRTLISLTAESDNDFG